MRNINLKILEEYINIYRNYNTSDFEKWNARIVKGFDEKYYILVTKYDRYPHNSDWISYIDYQNFERQCKIEKILKK